MDQKKLKLSVLFFLGIGLTGLKAQEALPATGGNASGSGGSVSYSIGQVAYTTQTGTTGSVIQGVQQPFEISVLTGLEEAKGINLSVSAYPNPTTGFLTLSVDNLDSSELSYHMYDMKGKLIETKKVVGMRTCIFMSNLVSATYFIRITEGTKEIKTFIIIKK